RPLGKLIESPGDDLRRLADDLLPALPAVRPANPREQQPHVVVDFGRRPDRRAWIPDAVLLADGNGRANPLDLVDVRLLHPLEELPRIRRQRLEVPGLPLRANSFQRP